MTERDINDAQDYLIIDYGNKRKEILNITTLLQNHTLDEVIRFLKGYLRENQKIMRQQLLRDKTNPCLERWQHPFGSAWPLPSWSEKVR